MQVIKRILIMVIISSISMVMLTACNSTIGIKDIEDFLSKEINKIMIGAIEGRNFQELSIQDENKIFEDWYNHTREQWYIEPSDNESYTFQARIEEIRVVSKQHNEVELKCKFTYEYTRAINDNTNKDEYVIGNGEIGETVVKIVYNNNQLMLMGIQPIIFFMG